MPVMNVVVGSSNPKKIEAVEELLLGYHALQPIKVVGAEIASGVSEQPLSLEEAARGAVNRAREAAKIGDVGIGIEAGIYASAGATQSGFFNTTVAVICAKGRTYTGLSSSFEWPLSWVELMRAQGVSVGKAAYMSGFAPDSNRARADNEGLIGELTGGRLTRVKYVQEAVRAALVQYMNRQLYLGQAVCTVCSREKAEGILPASELYLGTHIKLVESHAEKHGRPFFILSGMHGLVEGRAPLRSYDYLLSAEKIPHLAERVAEQLAEQHIGTVDLYVKAKPNWTPYFEALLEAAARTETVVNLHWLPDDA